MIIVLGTATGTEATIAALLAASLEHVRRSRTEPGCVSHDVARDAENPLRLMFSERWATREALELHFRVTGSKEFAAAVGVLTDGEPTLDIYSTS